VIIKKPNPDGEPFLLVVECDLRWPDTVDDVKLSCNELEISIIDKYLCRGKKSVIKAAAELNCSASTARRYIHRLIKKFSDRLGL